MFLVPYARTQLEYLRGPDGISSTLPSPVFPVADYVIITWNELDVWVRKVEIPAMDAIRSAGRPC